MRTSIKKLLAILLVVAMTVSVIGVSVFAEPTSTTKQFKGYTIIGDSITSGYSVEKDPNWDANLVPKDVDYGILMNMVASPEGYYSVQDVEALRQLGGGTTYRVHGAYPDLVADALGYVMPDDSAASYAALESNGYYNLSLPGLRSCEVREMVDPSYHGDDISQDIWDIVQKDGKEVMFQKAEEYIKNSEVMTINIGSNDVAINCFIRALKVIDQAGADTQALNYIRAAVALGDYATATSYLLEAAKLLGVFPLAAAAYLQGLATGLTTFTENWDPIIKNIKRINPDIKIYAVGFNNPFKNFHITDLGDEYWLRIGHALDILLQTMNVYVTQLSSQKDQITFVKTWDAEPIGMGTLVTGLIDGSYFKYILFTVHPTNAGHRYIADQILQAMKDDPFNTSEEPINPGTSTGRYTDVNEGDWCYDFIEYVSNRGIMTGMTQTTFEPYSNLTRAQVATILYALEGKPGNSNNAFGDVASNAWYFDPVNWCATQGIVAGTGNGNYEPNRNVTREELATMLRGYAAYIGGDTESAADISGFNDASSVSSWATGPISWAVAKGLMSGRPGNLIAPQGTASRAEMAVMMKNFCEVFGK